jgi:hypothetical protein
VSGERSRRSPVGSPGSSEQVGRRKDEIRKRDRRDFATGVHLT